MNAEAAFEVLQKLGIALGLGLLIGMQRQRTDSRLAGIRTFPLLTVLGTVTAFLAEEFGGWILAAGFIGLALLVLGEKLRQKPTAESHGITSEVTLFLMFGVGAYLVQGPALAVVVLVGIVAILLHLKPEMHSLVRKMGDQDFRAIMQFVLISLVILPVLPNETYGPYKVLNPYKIWLLVVLIVGMSLAGYVLYKFLEARTGSIVAGVVGGMISSTATTVSYARRARDTPASASAATLVIMVASAVVFCRVLAIIGFTAPQHFRALAAPIGAMLGVMLLLAAGTWFLNRKAGAAMPKQGNPTELKSALIFAVMFAFVLLGVAWAKDVFGDRGLYTIAALAGLTDMDAITLSALQAEQVKTELAWRMIIVASLANLVFKAGVAAISGGRNLLARLAAPFGIAFACGVLLLVLWPDNGPEAGPGAPAASAAAIPQ